MLRTGNRGFTLVEVLLSVAIVTAGLIFILQAMGKEINVVSIADDKIETALFLRHKISEAEKDLAAKAKITPVSQTGEMLKNGKSYQWALSIDENGQLKNLYNIRAVCLWQKFGMEKINAIETRFYKMEKEGE